MKTTQPDIDTLHARLDTLRLPFIREHCGPRTTEAAKKSLTHLGYLAAALGHAACQLGMRVLFANAIDVINTLSTAQAKGTLKAELRRNTSPARLILDELGYLSIGQRGADPLFQVISARYGRGSVVLTTSEAVKHWPAVFIGDSTITSAVLGRLLHHGHTVVIEGSSLRKKDRLES